MRWDDLGFHSALLLPEAELPNRPAPERCHKRCDEGGWYSYQEMLWMFLNGVKPESRVKSTRQVNPPHFRSFGPRGSIAGTATPTSAPAPAPAPASESMISRKPDAEADWVSGESSRK